MKKDTMATPEVNREAQRHLEQLAFVTSGKELIHGSLNDFSFSPEQLAKTCGDESYVATDMGGGLTAHVYKIQSNGRFWTLKRAREKCLVQNVDGQTSFLNEVQRRIDISSLKNNPATADRMNAIVDTQYASYRNGIILSPWIEGEHVTVWNERQLIELFDVMIELLQAGLFEWDFCTANILDDGHIRLFDFGYMYRFDPLTEFNSNGRAAGLFHGAERFETRCYFAYLYDLEKSKGKTEALSAYRMEKEIAIEAYQRLLFSLQGRGAIDEVIVWLQDILKSWRQGLKSNLENLYLAEGWRSHRLDVDDDLRGQTCTPQTLARIGWLQDTAKHHYKELLHLNAFFGGDKLLSREQLFNELEQAQCQAQQWQIKKST